MDENSKYDIEQVRNSERNYENNNILIAHYLELILKKIEELEKRIDRLEKKEI